MASLVLLSAAAGVCAADMPAPRDACPAQTLYALTEASLLPAGHEAPLAAQACRIWPYDPALALAAVAYPSTGARTTGERSLRLVVAVLDAQDARVLAVHQTDLEEDAAFALAEDGLLLDTARYDLAERVRAFGVVVRSSARGPSCPDARANDELMLYVRDGDSVRPVFTSHLDFWSRVEGEPCSWTRDQRLVIEEAALTIGVERGARNGRADLRVTADVLRTETQPGGDIDSSVRRRDSRVVHYDGTRYDTAVLRNGFFWAEDPVDP